MQIANPNTRGGLSMDDNRMQENRQEQNSDGGNVPADEEGSDQGEVMYEEDVLEEIDDDPSPENGL